MKRADDQERSAEFYRSIPKIDLHPHLEGSLRFSTLRELARSQAMDLPPTTELRFTPVALSRAQGFPPAQVMDWVI